MSSESSSLAAAADVVSSSSAATKTSHPCWKGQLWFDEASPDHQSPQLVNLCDYLPAGFNRKQYPPKTRYMFPDRFVGAAALLQLILELKLAAIASGFCLISRSSHDHNNNNGDNNNNNNNRYGSRNRLKTIVLSCSKKCANKIQQQQRQEKESSTAGGAADKTAKNGKKRKKMSNTTTHKTKNSSSSDEQLCGFRITIFLGKNHADGSERWFLSTVPSSKEQGCCDHNFHTKLEPSQLHLGIACLSQQELQLAKKSVQLRFSCPAAARLILSSSEKNNKKNGQEEEVLDNSTHAGMAQEEERMSMEITNAGSTTTTTTTISDMTRGGRGIMEGGDFLTSPVWIARYNAFAAQAQALFRLWEADEDQDQSQQEYQELLAVMREMNRRRIAARRRAASCQTEKHQNGG